MKVRIYPKVDATPEVKRIGHEYDPSRQVVIVTFTLTTGASVEIEMRATEWDELAEDMDRLIACVPARGIL